MSEAPNAGRIFETLNAFQRSAALRGAIELDLFSLIGTGLKTVEEIAPVCGAKPRALRILCDFLVVDQFLTKSGSEYGLSPTAALFLDRQSGQYMGETVRFMHSDHLWEAFDDVAALVRHGGTLLHNSGTTQHEYEGWVEFANSMVPLMRAPAEFIGSLVAERMSGPVRVLDIAAGHGLFGITIAQRNSQAEITALDWPNVLQVAQVNARRAGVESRLTLLPGDAFELDYGAGYDVILLTNFLHHFSSQGCQQVMHKVVQALKPEGLVVTLEFIPNEDRVSPPSQAMFAFTMLGTTPEGDAYTFREYRDMWQSAGLTQHELFDVPRAAQRVILSQR